MNVGNPLAGDISKIIGVKKVNSFGIYLEILAHDERNKSRYFNKLRDRVSKVHQGW